MTGTNQKGYTLIELVIVIAVFAIIIVAAVSAFVSVVQYQRRLLSQQEVLNQSNYAIEYMGRALRMAKNDISGECLGVAYIGYNYAITNDGYGIKFINHSDGDSCQEFRLDPASQEIVESKDGSDPISLFADSVQVNYFNFRIYGEVGSDYIQPRVAISIEVQRRGEGDQPLMKIQTTVSQRSIDD